MELEGNFEQVSRSPLFDELVEEEEPVPTPDAANLQQIRQRTISLQVICTTTNLPTLPTNNHSVDQYNTCNSKVALNTVLFPFKFYFLEESIELYL